LAGTDMRRSQSLLDRKSQVDFSGGLCRRFVVVLDESFPKFVLQRGMDGGSARQRCPEAQRFVPSSSVLSKPLSIEHQRFRAVGGIVVPDADAKGRRDLLQRGLTVATIQCDLCAQLRSTRADGTFDAVFTAGIQQVQVLLGLVESPGCVMQQRQSDQREGSLSLQPVFVGQPQTFQRKHLAFDEPA
jgi:hypothetical protein